MIDTVIFDLGGVLSLSGRQSDVGARFPAEHAETVRQIFLGPYHEDSDHPWHRLERGEITLSEMRRLNKIALEEAGIEIPPPPPGGSNSIPFTFEPSEPMVALVVALREAGMRTGVLTNNVAEMRPLWEPMMDFASLFDDVVDSSAVGLRKPNPAIYRLALERLGSHPERSVFLDDVQSNIDAAVAIGMTGVLVEEDQSTAIAETRRLVGLPPRTDGFLTP